MRRTASVIAILLAAASPAAAQLQTQVVVTGLSSPVALVQDPALADTQYVVEQGGRIRVVRSGQLSATDFLDLRGAIASGGERGLLGLAFAPDYASSGRFFVNFTNSSGNTVVARFTRSSADPRRADAASRFDLRWPDGNRFITQPYSNHNGGNLQFGPDGHLYIGLGDGGSGDDPEHRAQTPSTLLGKMLRIDVGVSAADPEGYDVPADNPFVGRSGYLSEIWAFGLRNPWRYTFDSFGSGATGALIIGDGGQGRYEEIDYEPASKGGRNYGWRNREGAHDEVTTLPPAFTPLKDPLYEYGRTVGQTVIGGYVYRGSALPTTYGGRYFFADYITPRVWSLTLSIDGAGEATAAALTEHTTELGGASALGNVSSFGIDASGELYLVSHSKGEIRRIASAARSSQLTMALDAPTGGTLVQPFRMGGWAIDRAQADGTTGVDTVHLWAFPTNGSQPIFLGAAYGAPRADVAAVYGSNYENSGFGLQVSGLAAGTYNLSAHARSTVTDQFEGSAAAQVSIVTGPAIVIDAPAEASDVPARFTMGGWAIDRDSATGTGVDAVHVWAYPRRGLVRQQPPGPRRRVRHAIYELGMDARRRRPAARNVDARRVHAQHGDGNLPLVGRGDRPHPKRRARPDRYTSGRVGDTAVSGGGVGAGSGGAGRKRRQRRSRLGVSGRRRLCDLCRLRHARLEPARCGRGLRQPVHCQRLPGDRIAGAAAGDVRPGGVHAEQRLWQFRRGEGRAGQRSVASGTSRAAAGRDGTSKFSDTVAKQRMSSPRPRRSAWNEMWASSVDNIGHRFIARTAKPSAGEPLLATRHAVISHAADRSKSGLDSAVGSSRQHPRVIGEITIPPRIGRRRGAFQGHRMARFSEPDGCIGRRALRQAAGALQYANDRACAQFICDSRSLLGCPRHAAFVDRVGEPRRDHGGEQNDHAHCR